MREVSYLAGISKSLEGDLIVSFKVEDSEQTIEDLGKLKDDELIIEVKKHKKSRSLDANAYFWTLCDKIARVLGTDKDTIYLLMLESAGVFIDVGIVAEAYDKLVETYRLVTKLYEFKQDHETAIGTERIPMIMCRCYIGSHTYNTTEMSRLIEFAVNQASDLKIDVLTPDEREHMMHLWDEKLNKTKGKIN